MSDIFDISGLVVVLTGSSGVIGRTLAPALLERGARLALVDLPATEPDRGAQHIGGGAHGFNCDVTQADQVDLLLRRVLKTFGQVDVLINNHQYKPDGFLEAQPESFPENLWDAIVDVNLKGTFLMCRDFGQQMLSAGRGSIVNVASVYGVVSSNPDLYSDNSLGNPLAYSASKGGVVMLTKYLGAHWGERGVRVNCITPHGVRNDHEAAFESRFIAKSPMKRMMNASEVVGPVVFLASNASSYATGSNLIVDGGWTVW
jgi:NAD(P)-dependent dehydrogenase (short-subunit alcohol dehydrogenase family)